MSAKHSIQVSHASPCRFDEAPAYDQAVLPLSVFVSRLIAAPRATGKLSFREATSREDLCQVYQFRIQQYARALPYMLNELNDEGVDDFDHHSYTFGAWWNDRVVGSIRLTPHPFETPRYVPEEHMAAFLGEQCCGSTVRTAFTTPIRLVSMVSAHALAEFETNGPIGPCIPAAHTRTSSLL